MKLLILKILTLCLISFSTYASTSIMKFKCLNSVKVVMSSTDEGIDILVTKKNEIMYEENFQITETNINDFSEIGTNMKYVTAQSVDTENYVSIFSGIIPTPFNHSRYRLITSFGIGNSDTFSYNQCEKL